MPSFDTNIPFAYNVSQDKLILTHFETLGKIIMIFTCILPVFQDSNMAAGSYLEF